MSHYSTSMKYEIPEEAFANPLNPTVEEVYTWANDPENIKPSNLHGALIVFEETEDSNYKYIWRTIDTGVDFTVLTLKSMPPIQDVRVTGEVEVIGPLTDEELRASPIEVTGSLDVDIDTTALATHAKQDEQSVLLQTLQSLIETNNNLVQILSPLGSAMSSGQPALRITPTGTTLPVSGTVTASVASTVVSSVTNFGTGVPAKEMADDFNNLLVHMGNITNVTV